jgi:hypothetical protein
MDWNAQWNSEIWRVDCLESFVCLFKRRIVFRKTLNSRNVTVYESTSLFLYMFTNFNLVFYYKVMTPPIFKMLNWKMNFCLMFRQIWYIMLIKTYHKYDSQAVSFLLLSCLISDHCVTKLNLCHSFITAIFDSTFGNMEQLLIYIYRPVILIVGTNS